MNAVGIDVSKGKSMVAIMRPFGEIVSTYWHVDCVRKMSINAFIDHYENWCKRKKYNFSKSKAEEIYGKAKELVPVLPKDDITKLIIKQAVDQLNSASITVESLRTLMNETASKLPEYYVYMTAGANKFLRIYYGRVKEYLASLPES